MKAIHVISTAPFTARNIGQEYRAEDFDLWNTALSALMWQKLNGEIKLVTDKIGAEYYEKIGLLPLWNEVDARLPESYNGVDALTFWAAGKLFALQGEAAPCVIIDTDFIVWDKLTFGKKIIGAHREELNPNIYPPADYFKLTDYPEMDFDMSVLPVNTAFLYIPDESFKQYYTSQAIAFMRSAQKTNDRLCYMVFTEQRLLAMCADKLGFEIQTLLDKNRLFVPQDSFTHLWGAKQAMRDNPNEREKFCERCKQRLLSDFPDYRFIADRITAAVRQQA